MIEKLPNYITFLIHETKNLTICLYQFSQLQPSLWKITFSRKLKTDCIIIKSIISVVIDSSKFKSASN